VIGTAILTFAVYRLRRGDDDFFHRQALAYDQFKQQRGADGIDLQKAGEVRHVILIRRLVGDDIDALQGRQQNVAIGYVACNEARPCRHVARQTVGMHSGIEVVQYDHLEALAQKTVG
jgi:hypothetical protein